MIRQAIARVGKHHPQLGKHLSRTVNTGTYCSYAPDPRALSIGVLTVHQLRAA
jgi:hypothetical protein